MSSEKTAWITNDRTDDGVQCYWVDLGTFEEGITDQGTHSTLEEARAECENHLLPEGGLILHFTGHGNELETTYGVKGTEYG